MNRRTPLALLALVGLLLGTVACSSEESVGNRSLTDFEQQTPPPSLGPSQPASAKPVATRPPVVKPRPVVTTAKPAASQQPKPKPRQSAPAAVLKIDINGDNTTSTQFNPANAAAFAGTIITWTNRDGVPRGVKAEDGSFASGPLAPGKSYSWTASKAGRYQYSDSTRPYAVATLTVQARG